MVVEIAASSAANDVTMVLRSLEEQPKAHSHLKVTVIITISRESLKGEDANDIARIANAGVAIAN